MLHKHIEKSKATIWPEDLAILARVFEAVCDKRQLDRSSLDAERIAVELIDFIRHGIRDERQLETIFCGKQ